MADLEKVIKGWERCEECRKHPIGTSQAYLDCEYTVGLYCGQDKLIWHTLEVLKEFRNKHLIDVDELIKELGFSKDCENCDRDARKCQYEYRYSLMDFCGMLDDAIDAIEKRQQ